MILEGIATTLCPDGRLNISPMGPRVTPDMRRLTLRPFKTSKTYMNLKAHGQGVFHVTDDVELLARAALGDVETELRPARVVKGYILSGACRAYEFQVTSIDDREERATIEAEVLGCENLRDFFGLNRAKHAVVEAAILATRIDFLPLGKVQEELAALSVLVQKTGGAAERRAFDFLEDYVAQAARRKELEAIQANGRCAVRVSTGSRLHFGLLAAGGGTARQFGGAGLMVARPGITLEVERSDAPEATGPLAERAMEFARKCGGGSLPHYRIRILSAPRGHVGLGTGTQLAMALGRALAVLGEENVPNAELALRMGRGRRSGVGVHGFAEGGFMVDAGKRAGGGLPPLAIRVGIPAGWRFLLAIPRDEAGISGRLEEDAFLRLAGLQEERAPDLCRILLLGIVPAILEGDLKALGSALYEYGVRSGEIFKSVQGGTFGSAFVREIVEFLKKGGVHGPGQSSWGPAVYGVVEGEDAAKHWVKRLEERFGPEALEVMASEPMNTGARVERV